MEILDNFDFDETAAKNTIYPWAEWTDGQARKAVKNVDYICNTSSFVQGLYAHAKRIGQKVKTQRNGESVIFQFSK